MTSHDAAGKGLRRQRPPPRHAKVSTAHRGVEEGMAEDSSEREKPAGPAIGAEGVMRGTARRQRLAEALRENLHKRKQQARDRSASAEEGS